MKKRLADGSIVDLTPEEIAQRDTEHTAMQAEDTRQQALANLKELDQRSIRHLREHLASQVPELDAIERGAVVERAKVTESGR